MWLPFRPPRPTRAALQAFLEPLQRTSQALTLAMHTSSCWFSHLHFPTWEIRAGPRSAILSVLLDQRRVSHFIPASRVTVGFSIAFGLAHISQLGKSPSNPISTGAKAPSPRLRVRPDPLQFAAHKHNLWDSYGLGQYKLRAGSLSEDSRGRWYLNVAVKVQTVAPSWSKPRWPSRRWTPAGHR